MKLAIIMNASSESATAATYWTVVMPASPPSSGRTRQTWS